MNPCDIILKLGELKTREYAEAISNAILKEFLSTTNANFIFNKNWVTSIDKLINLKYQYICTNPQYKNLFFNILNKYNYNTKFEVKDAIFFLGSLKNPNDNKKTIHDIIASTLIKDISFNGKDIFKIYSEQYGNISFQLATIYFKNNKLGFMSSF